MTEVMLSGDQWSRLEELFDGMLQYQRTLYELLALLVILGAIWFALDMVKLFVEIWRG